MQQKKEKKQPKMYNMAWGYKISRPVILDSGVLAGFFARILKRKMDFAVTVYGGKRMGKSISTAELMRQIAIINKKPFSIENDIVFYLKDFYKTMDNAEPLTCKMLDDFGSEADSRRSMEGAAIDLSHYFHTSGTEQVGYFITTPTQGWINKDIRERVANYFMWITGKNTQKNYCTAKIFYLQKNESKRKVYTHNLFISPQGIVNNRGIGNAVTEWVLYPLPKPLQDEYYPHRLKKAERNLEKGLQNVLINEEKKKEFKPYEVAKEILKDIDRYYYTQLGRKTKSLDKGLIQADFNIGGRRFEQVKSIIAKKIQDTEGEEEKPPI